MSNTRQKIKAEKVFWTTTWCELPSLASVIAIFEDIDENRSQVILLVLRYGTLHFLEQQQIKDCCVGVIVQDIFDAKFVVLGLKTLEIVGISVK